MTGTPAQLAGAGITVGVPGDATTQLSADSADAAGNRSSCSAAIAYIEDSNPPPAPTITGTDPDSPANDNNPEVRGSAGGGATSVELFTNATCSGPSAGAGSVPSFAAPGITITVPSDATTQISARSADAAGNDSSCSGSISYTEDSSAPPAPTLTGTAPASPANDNDPAVQGAAGGDAGAVNIYASDDCSGATAAVGTAAELSGPGIPVTVQDDSTTDFSARSIDGANISPCSQAIEFREDSTAPETVFDEVPPTKVKFHPRKRIGSAIQAKGGRARFGFSTNEPASSFLCKLDDGEWKSCSSPIKLTKLGRGRHVFSVRSVDLAGNLDPTPATHGFKVVRKRAKKPPPA